MLKTIKEYEFEEWRRYMSSMRGEKTVEISGYRVRIESARLRLLLSKLPGRGRVCANCGRVGEKVCLQIETKPYKSFPKDKGSFFVYSSDGVMLTCDHIFPKSKGGNTSSKNLQTLCQICNSHKAATIPMDIFSENSYFQKYCSAGC
jgi:5-methylcytosine-specific restriction endonuclease McrA